MGRSVHSSFIYGVFVGEVDYFEEWGPKLGLDDDLEKPRDIQDSLEYFASEYGLEVTICCDDEYPSFVINIPDVGWSSGGINEVTLPESWEIDSERQDQVKALQEIAKKLGNEVSWILTATMYV